MKVHRGFDALSPGAFERPVATIGVFDGMHLGHRAVIDTTRDLARDFGGDAVAITFEIHPWLVTRGQAPRPITSVAHRLVLLERYGVDHTVLLPFTEEVRSISAEDFSRRVFVEGLAVKGIVLGFDSHFGRDRQGDIDFVREWAADRDIVVRSAPPVLRDGRPISSSAIRDAIARGQHDLAQDMLGRPVAVFGKVVPGSGRGADLGFATANVDVSGELTPPLGVYAAWTRLEGRWRPALVNIGRRPTFEEDGDVTVEVHIPGVAEPLYGRELEVQFVSRIRSEKQFASAEELTAQIGRDRGELDRIVRETGRPR